MVAVVAVAAAAGARVWRAHDVPGQWRSTASPSLPLVNLVQEVGWSMQSGAPLTAAWDLLYVLLILGTTAAAMTILIPFAIPGSF
jgi:hypothetical protein